MIALLHGYLLDGSGSNLWTQAVARSLCRIGEHVHVVCQEREPQDFDFVAEARVYPRGSTTPEVLFRRDTSFPGRCVLHRPELGDTLPVYVPDRYEGFEHVVPMVDLPDHEIDAVPRARGGAAGVPRGHWPPACSRWARTSAAWPPASTPWPSTCRAPPPIG